MTSIPPTIHYCWFGHTPLPKSARKCIASWKKFFPNYEIKEWNETNFDVNIIPYTREAYELKKYAFVSDYARFYILYHHGGLYFDTDVEVIRSMDDIVVQGAFMGMEGESGINPGLGIGATSMHKLYKEILDYYAGLHYPDDSGTVVTHTTHVFCRHGFQIKDGLQQVSGIWIYPNDYFNPLDDATGRLIITENTRSIHHYAKTWCDNYGPVRIWVTRWMHRIWGINSFLWLKRFLHFISRSHK